MPHPLHHQLKQRLFDLSPRAFEFFAGDLLTFMGLDSVTVTRQSGDGGIDAHCELVSGGILRVPAGVQVKKWRQPVSRPEMDRFAGALANRYACGIYVTTAGFTHTARQKAASIPHITPVDGDQVAHILLAEGAGVDPHARTLDESYFAMFEAQAAGSAEPRALAENRTAYNAAPVDDLISLRALSYSLHVDSKTVRSWVGRGLLLPDAASGDIRGDGTQSGLFFRRSRVEDIRRQFRLQATPAAPEEWVARFLHFAMGGRLNMSYKPVLLLALLDCVDSQGAVAEETLAAAFWQFYRQRAARGLPAEAASSILSRPEEATLAQVRRLMVEYPLDRFVIQGLLERLPEEGLVRVRPEVWAGLRYGDVILLRRDLEEQVGRYYARIPGHSL